MPNYLTSLLGGLPDPQPAPPPAALTSRGLLGDVLPWAYSQGNRLKRNITGLLADPVGAAEQTMGLLADSANQKNALMAAAFGDAKNPLQITNRNALSQLAGDVLTGPLGFAPAGMTKFTRLPSRASLNTPSAPTPEVLQRFGRVEDVPLSMTRGTQPRMDWEGFRAGNSPGPLVRGYADKPVAVRREDGEYLIFDGHHRTVDAMNNGQNALSMYVVDAKAYAPEAAGRKTARASVDTDELLRGLLGD